MSSLSLYDRAVHVRYDRVQQVQDRVMIEYVRVDECSSQITVGS